MKPRERQQEAQKRVGMRAQYTQTGTLWSGDQEDLVAFQVLEDLREAFGAERDAPGSMRRAAGFGQERDELADRVERWT